jgi:aspartyl-tRNA synthetase
VIFVDLRDREGLVRSGVRSGRQDFVRRSPNGSRRNEFVVSIEGLVRARPEGTANANLRSGKIEMLGAAAIESSSRSEPLPFQLDENVLEELRLKYRYLDLRRDVMSQRFAPASRDHACHAPLSRRATASSTSKRRC